MSKKKSRMSDIHQTAIRIAKERKRMTEKVDRKGPVKRTEGLDYWKEKFSEMAEVDREKRGKVLRFLLIGTKKVAMLPNLSFMKLATFPNCGSE